MKKILMFVLLLLTINLVFVACDDENVDQSGSFGTTQGNDATVDDETPNGSIQGDVPNIDFGAVFGSEVILPPIYREDLEQ